MGLDSMPSQGLLSVLASFIGILSVAGPSSFVRGYLSASGSLLGGLLVAACANHFATTSSPFWIDSVLAVAGGGGNLSDYLLWLVIFVLGVTRWLTGCECGLYDVVDEVEIEKNGAVSVLHMPLLPNTT